MMASERTRKKAPPPPYSIRVQDMKEHFVIAPQTVYQWINQGRLQRGEQALKVGGRIFVVRLCQLARVKHRPPKQLRLRDASSRGRGTDILGIEDALTLVRKGDIGSI